MRKLMWFTIGFILACITGVYFISGQWLLLLAGFSLAGMLGVFFLQSAIAKRAALTLLGCLIGFLWLYGFHAFYLQNARNYDGETVHTSVEITDYSYETQYGISADGALKLDGKTYKVRLYTKGELLSPGDTVTGEFRLQYTVDGGERSPSYHQGKGIFLIARGKGEPVVVRQSNPPAKYFGAVLRRNILSQLDRMFPEDTEGFARALLLGDSSKLTESQRDDFSVSGISHVIAVSGLHVSILFSLVYELCFKRKYLTALFGIPVLILFAAVAGFTPSILRACIMQILMIIALLINKEYDPPTALSFAVLTMLAANPLGITSVSLQLSAGCMVGIFLFSEKIRTYLLQEKRLGTGKGKGIRARLTRWLASSVSVTLGAVAVTTPLCAYYFGLVSLVGVFTNIATLWVISFIFYGVVTSVLAGLIWTPLGQGIAWLASWLIRYVLWVAKTLAGLPFSAVYTGDGYIIAWLIFAYVLLAVLLAQRKKRPVVALCCIAVSLFVCLHLSAVERKYDEYCLTVVDVGHGQAVLYESGEESLLIDCGGSSEYLTEERVLDVLRSRGISELDGILLTHYDRDHAGAVSAVAERIPVEKLYLPNVEDEGVIRQELTQKYADRIFWVDSDWEMTVGHSKMTVYTAPDGKNENERSLCVLFQTKNYDILITGDRGVAGERRLLEEKGLPKLEILVVGHHGSHTSTSIELLQETRPKHAVISAGDNASYDLPSEQTLRRLRLFDCRIWRTDLSGTITFRR